MDRPSRGSFLDIAAIGYVLLDFTPLPSLRSTISAALDDEREPGSFVSRTGRVQQVFAQLRIVFEKVCQTLAMFGELDAVSWGCHRTIPDSEPDAACRRRPALLGARWSRPPLTLMI